SWLASPLTRTEKTMLRRVTTKTLCSLSSAGPKRSSVAGFQYYRGLLFGQPRYFRGSRRSTLRSRPHPRFPAPDQAFSSPPCWHADHTENGRHDWKPRFRVHRRNTGREMLPCRSMPRHRRQVRDPPIWTISLKCIDLGSWLIRNDTPAQLPDFGL